MACAKRSCLGLAQYSKGRHHEAQREAERTGQGVWKGSYVEPWLFRAYIRASGKPSPVRTMQMPIPERSQQGANPQRALAWSPYLGKWLWRVLGDSRYPSFSIASLRNE